MEMPGIVGWLAVAITLAAFVVALAAARREKSKRRLLTWDSGHGLALARSHALGDYKLNVVFVTEAGEERVSSAHVQSLVFVNLGREPIRRTDLADANPLRVRVEGARVLSTEVEKFTRDVCRIGLTSVREAEGGAETLLTFDFLDHMDGGRVRILTEGRPAKVSLVGDVIGMPGGIPELGSLRERGRALKWTQVAATVLLFLVPQAVIAVFFLRAIEGWVHLLWLYAPIVAFVASALFAAGLDSLFSPSARALRLPDTLRSSPWTRHRVPPDVAALVMAEHHHGLLLEWPTSEETDSDAGP